jgi:hypothetical protein
MGRRRCAMLLALIPIAGSLLASDALARTGSLPTRIGECRETRIVQITTR